MADPKTILEFVKKNNVKMLDLRFTDLPGLWQHVSYPIEQLSEDSFEEGFGMDGSSIRGWAAINESDMLLVPDPAFYMLDPFTEIPTLVLICDAVDPGSPTLLSSAPRPSSSFSTTSASISASSTASTSSMPKKVAGTQDAKKKIWAIDRAIKKDIFQSRPPITTRTSAPRWS
jgi:hypothetical protein